MGLQAIDSMDLLGSQLKSTLLYILGLLRGSDPRRFKRFPLPTQVGTKIYKISASPQPKNKPMSGAGSPSCRPRSVQLNLYKNMKRQLILTARPGEEVDKRIKQKYIYLNKLSYRFENKPCSTFLQGIKNLLQRLNCFQTGWKTNIPKPFFKVIRKSLYFTRFVTRSITVRQLQVHYAFLQ